MFDKLKEIMMDKIERNAVKSVLDNKVVYLKKSKFFGEWREINPPVNEDGSWNIRNLVFGGSANLFRLIIMLAIAGMFLFALWESNKNLTALLSDPCVQNCIQNPINFLIK